MFNQTIPPKVTASYLVAVLGGKESSVKGNVLTGLQAVGLVDQDGSTTSRAKLWRDENSYPDVCKQIREELYPSDLLNAIPGPLIDKDAAKRWFMTKTGCGEVTARKMVGLYSLLMEADPSGGEQVAAPSSNNAMVPESKKQPKRTVSSNRKGAADRRGSDSGGAPIPRLDMPDMRLSVEVRIDGSVTPEQIDLIFASMAKHLYGRENEGR